MQHRLSAAAKTSLLRLHTCHKNAQSPLSSCSTAASQWHGTRLQCSSTNSLPRLHIAQTACLLSRFDQNPLSSSNLPEYCSSTFCSSSTDRAPAATAKQPARLPATATALSLVNKTL
jgi:hypothetical protein